MGGGKAQEKCQAQSKAIKSRPAAALNCGWVFLCFAPNDAGQPRAQTGEKLIGDGARRLSCCFGGEHGVAIPADERGGISRADIGDLGHIRQKLIHTDQTRNRGRLAVEQYPASAAGKGAGPAVGITDCDQGQPGRAGCGERPVVSGVLARLQSVDLGYPGPERKDRAQVGADAGMILGSADQAIQRSRGP